MNWYKIAKLKKTASMSVYVSDYESPAKKDDLLSVSFIIMDKFFKSDIYNQMSEFEKAYYLKNQVSNFITPDGDDFDKPTGIMSVYLKGFPERLITDIINFVSKMLIDDGFRLGQGKVEKSRMYDSNVARIPIIANPHVNKNNDTPPELNMANMNANIVLGKVLGYDTSEGELEITIFDLLNRISKVTPEQIEANERPWSREWGNGKVESLEGAYTAEQIKASIDKLKEIAEWAMSHGYKRLSVA